MKTQSPTGWTAPMEFDPAAAVPLPETEGDPKVPAPAALLPPRRPGRGAAKLLVGSLALLVLAAIGFDTLDLVARAFAWSPWAGASLTGLAGLAVASLAVMTGREALAWRRLRAVDRLRQQATRLLAQGGPTEDAREVKNNVAALYRGRPGMAAPLHDLDTAVTDAHDARETLALVDRILLTPVDAAAYRLVLAASRDVAIGTALSPAALLDALLVLWRNMRLVRQVAGLYAARPGLFGSARLVRRMAENIGVAGMAESGDGLVVDLLGGSLAAALSARIGQGMINGLLTARIGLTAMHLCRPLPFPGDRQPGLAEIRRELLSLPRQVL